MKDLHTAFDQLVDEQEKLRLQFQTQAQGLFKQITKQFFEQNPHIKTIIWNQYTPYFNDGEECIFSVNEPVFTNAEGEDLEDMTSWGEYEGERDDIWTWEGWGTPPEGVDVSNCTDFARIICSEVMSNVMLAMFDNHVTVTATKDGFDVVEYDHD